MSDAPLPAAVELERPRFHNPRADPLEPGPTPAVEIPSPSPSVSGDADGHPETTTRARASSAGSSPGSRGAIVEDLGDAAYGALVIVFGLAWIAHRWLRRDPGRQLREPTEHDYQAISAPLGRIAARHLPIDVAPSVALSIKDGAASVGAARRYAASGPLLERVDLEQPPEGEQPS